MSGGMTERTSGSAIPGSNNEHLNDAIQGGKVYLNNIRVDSSH